MSLTDASGRLARWRLRLLEFDFTVKYRKGAANAIADAISRLPTFHECPVGPEVDVPCFLVEAGQDPPIQEARPLEPFWVRWTEEDVGDDAFPPEDLAMADPVLVAAAEKDPVAIRIDELVIEQSKDPYCRSIRRQIDRGDEIPFLEDDRGLLVRRAPLDDRLQIVVPASLRQRTLYLSHYPQASGHPGGTRMYYTLRRTFYWPSMSLDVHTCARQCTSCARERVQLRKHTALMKLFPASKPLEFVGIDILGPLPRASNGSRYLLVITDRYSKITRTVPLRTITAYTVAKAFKSHWVFPYGPPVNLLPDNGGQFASK